MYITLSESKSLQVSRTLLSILAVLSNAVIWIVATRPSSSKSSGPFNNPLVIVPKAKHNWYNRHFHVPQPFQFSSKVEVLILLFTFFQFYFVVNWNNKVNNFANSLFLLIIIRSGFLAEIRWSTCKLKSHRSYFLGQVLSYAYIIS